MTVRRALYAVSVVVLTVCLLPVFSVLVASGVASVAGCELDEGSVHACVIAGIDWGGTLYTLAILGWLALVTLPFAAIAAVVILLLALFDLIRYLRG